MYEALTAFIPFMKSGHFGTWSGEIIFRHVDYDEQIYKFNRTLSECEKEHTGSDWFNFVEIVENSGIKFNVDSLSTEDFSAWDGKTILAMMRYVFSMERWSDGLVLEFCKNGCFLRWLQRLKEIDESNKDTR